MRMPGATAHAPNIELSTTAPLNRQIWSTPEQRVPRFN